MVWLRNIPLKATYFPTLCCMEFGKSTQIVEQIEQKNRNIEEERKNVVNKKRFIFHLVCLSLVFPKCNEQQCESVWPSLYEHHLRM